MILFQLTLTANQITVLRCAMADMDDEGSNGDLYGEGNEIGRSAVHAERMSHFFNSSRALQREGLLRHVMRPCSNPSSEDYDAKAYKRWVASRERIWQVTEKGRAALLIVDLELTEARTLVGPRPKPKLRAA